MCDCLIPTVHRGRSLMHKSFEFVAMLVGGMLVGTALTAAPAAAANSSGPYTFALITKTNENPVFVLEKEEAIAKAKTLGVKLLTFTGKYDGDNASQVTAIENSI